MSVERVRDYLKQFGVEGRIMEFDVSSATVELAAQAVGCEPRRIAKTLSFDMGERTALIVAAGDMKIDNSKFKAEFKTKAKMLKFDEAEARTGYAVGGVCPFCVAAGADVYLDASLKRFETIFPACGTSNSAAEFTPAELERFSENFVRWVDVCKTIE